MVLVVEGAHLELVLDQPLVRRSDLNEVLVKVGEELSEWAGLHLQPALIGHGFLSYKSLIKTPLKIRKTLKKRR